MPRPPRASVPSVTRSMRWSPDEWAAVERLAAQRGCDASHLLRELVAEECERIADAGRRLAAKAFGRRARRRKVKT